jgi:rfaE bifunctional protein kinase chain/domain
MNMRDITSFDPSALAHALAGISRARIALVGDICLDAYWTADMTKSELSRETPHFPLPIVSERYAPGAGGNAACNLAALNPQSLCVVGAIGDDWRGAVLRDALSARGVSAAHIVTSPSITTNAYIKPMRTGISGVSYEDARLDFISRDPLPPAIEDALIAHLDALVPSLDALVVCDQMPLGAITNRVRARINRLAADGLTVVVDSRDGIARFHHAILKPNEVELARATGLPADDPLAAARALANQNAARVLVTLGESGCAYVDGDAYARYGAVRVVGEIDICGAGDSFLAAFAAAMAGGAPIDQSIAVATLASAVTIQKIGQTGTATREEILAAFERAQTEGTL